MQTIFDLDTPALLVDGDRLERNIAAMAQQARTHGKNLRPHTKTHKTPEIARMQLAAGASGLTVAKTGEAEVLAEAGCGDLFIANQVVGVPKVERLLALARQTTVRVGADSREAAEPIGNEAAKQGLRIPMLIEVDTGLGRAGVRSDAEALILARFIKEHPGLLLVGIFTHEGHLYRTVDAGSRVGEAEKASAHMAHLRELMERDGLPCGVVSMGSTPGAAYLADAPHVTELRPGNYVFLDRIQVQLGADPEQCALTVLATVTSVRPDGKILVDAGTKALAGDCPFPDKTYGEIVGHPALQFVGASEEHGHLQSNGELGLRVGDKVRIVPNHACTCLNLHATLIAFRGETIEAQWPIAGRGKMQ